MKKYDAITLSDFYKQFHFEQYPKELTKMVSYFTPRMSRIQAQQKVTMFTLQSFIKEYLIENFNETFFKRSLKRVIKDYKRIIKYSVGQQFISVDKVIALHNLGYLPLEIKGLPEGTRCPMKVPMIEISNTHPDFMWVVNSIETVLSAEIWYPMLTANVGFEYRQIVNKWFDKTADDNIPRNTAISEFGFRGAESVQSGVKASIGFLLSFTKTATIPAIQYLEEYYNCDIKKEIVGTGMVSTEHSVMCSNTAIDGDEKTFIKRLCTEIYPNGNISIVCDSYDYWNIITNILPTLKYDILRRNGCVFVRGDSGDPIDIICGTKRYHYYNNIEDMKKYILSGKFSDKEIYSDNIGDYLLGNVATTYYKIYIDFNYDTNEYDILNYEKTTLTSEEKGTVECLFENFGGTINTKGYKILNKHIRAIYGDSITLNRSEHTYNRLEEKGYASNNVALGAGSFSMKCIEEYKNGLLQLSPFTRDTFSSCVKATYCETVDKAIPIFKDPKTDSGNFKKSQKGCCKVLKDELGELYYEDEFTFSEVSSDPNNQLETVFKDGKMIKEYSLSEIRNRLHNGKF